MKVSDSKWRRSWPRSCLRAIKPPDDITISQHAAKYRVLGRHSAIKGPYRLEMVPFFAPIMDACNNPDINEIVCCKPAQIGGTDAFLCVVGYYAHQEPCPIMVVLADEKTALYIGNEKIKAMFEDSPSLRKIYDPREATKSEIRLKNGGYITMAWASSVAQLASRPIRIVYFDEIDKDGYYAATKEANALSLGRERTNTYPLGFFKHLLSSTPTIDTGNITNELLSCDVIYDWHVPCPHCGQYQPLRWNREYTHGFVDGMYRAEDGTMHDFGAVSWEGGTKASNEQIDETARYICGECGGAWTTGEKNAAVRNGKMVPRTELKGSPRKVGFHLNRIYSLFDGGRLEELVRNFCRVMNHTGEKKLKEMQGFLNSTLAEPWKKVLVKSTEVNILQARCDLEPSTVPASAVALTCGIDVQKYGFWYVVRAWANNYTSWLIQYGYLNTWEDVDNLLFNTTWPVVNDSRRYRIWRAAIDTGGGQGNINMSMTEQAYWWLRNNMFGRNCRVWGTKGSSTPIPGKFKASQPFDKTPSGKPIPGGLQIWTIDTATMKDIVHFRLKAAKDGGESFAAYLNKDVGKDYAKQILAEEKRIDAKGAESWVQTYKDNHLLDAEVLAMSVAEPEWPGGGVNLVAEPLWFAPGEQEAAPRRRRAQTRRKGGMALW